MKRGLMIFNVIISSVLVSLARNQAIIYNTCGLSSTDEPNISSDCTSYEMEYGGKCCYMKYQKFPDPETGQQYSSYFACLAVQSYSQLEIDNAKIVASNLSYTIDLICSNLLISLSIYSIITITAAVIIL